MKVVLAIFFCLLILCVVLTDKIFQQFSEKKKFENCVNLLDAQLGQMKLMLNAIQKLEGTTD